MSEPRYDTSGPYILWQDFGYEGWKPYSFDTFKAALMAERWCATWIITRPVEIVESPTPAKDGDAP